MTPYIACQSCEGIGYYDVGDVEDGIEEQCEECGGDGVIEDMENIDLFIPERDAWRVQD